jgi:hypothetical protein
VVLQVQSVQNIYRIIVLVDGDDVRARASLVSSSLALKPLSLPSPRSKPRLNPSLQLDRDRSSHHHSPTMPISSK